MAAIRTILLPTDLTRRSENVARYAVEMARRFDADLVLVHVVEDLGRLARVFTPHPSTDVLQREAEEAARKAVASFAEENLADKARFSTVTVSGDTASEILKAAAESKADLLVMGTHGRAGLDEIIFGSVAEKVVKHSPIPVLVVNPDKMDGKGEG